MWYGVQNMSKYDIDIKEQPQSSNLIDHCRSETLSCQVLMQWQDIFIPEDNQALLEYQNTKTHLNIHNCKM